MTTMRELDNSGASERARQRAGLTWALVDLDGLLARGVIDATAYATLRHDYEARLRWLDAPPPVPHPTVAPTAPAAESPSPTPPTIPPVRPTGSPPETAGPAAPGAFATPLPSAGHGGAAPPPDTARTTASGAAGTLWINLLLYLGAFFVVMAALIFVSYSWRVLGGVAKTVIMAGFTAGFIVAGLLALRVPRVRPAGHTFLAIGALLTPLDLVGLYTLVLRQRGLEWGAVWAWGSLYCALFYGALALRRLGRAYAVAAVVAAVSAWGGLLVTLDLATAWQPAAFLVLPLLFLVFARLVERTALGRETFGLIPAVGAQLLVPPGIIATGSLLATGGNRAGLVLALGLALLFYVAAAASRAAGPGWHEELLAALLTATLFTLACGYAFRIPGRGYTALMLGLAWGNLVLAWVVQRRGAGWALLPFVIGWLHTAALLLPWSVLVRDRHALFWAILYGGAAGFVLASLWARRSSWHVLPLLLAIVLALFHLLREQFGVTRGEPFAWGFGALALLPLGGLWWARQRAISRVWDAQLLVGSQTIALVAALVSGRWGQLTLLLWLFVVAGAVVVVLERRAELLALPSLWAVAAIGASLALAGVERRWAPATYAGVGAALALGLQGWRGVPADRRPTWFMAHRWAAGGWAALGPLLASLLLIGAELRFLRSGDLRDLVLHPTYGPATLATALCGLALLLDAVVTLRRPTGYGASALFMVALLMAIARVTPDNPQAYAVPLGLYLLTLSVYVAYERDLGPVRMPAANGLLAAAVCVILGTTLVQSLVHPWRYIFLGLGEGLALLGVTLFLRRRYGVVLTLLFLVLTTLRALFDAARALPNWVVIGLLGLTLLGLGVFVLLRRDRFDTWGSAAAARWSRLM